MKKQRILNIPLFAGLIILSAATANATLIDDFSTPLNQLACDPTDVTACPAPNTTEDAAPTALGGVRFLSVNNEDPGPTGGGLVGGSANGTPPDGGNGVLSYFSRNQSAGGISGGGIGVAGQVVCPAGFAGCMEVTWDGVDDNDQSSLGLTLPSGFSSISFLLVGADQGDLGSAEAYFTVTDGAITRTSSILDLLATTDFTVYSLPIDTSGMGTIKSISFFVNANEDFDATFDNINTANGEIPEPGTYALLGIGLLSLALYRRRG